VSSEKSVNKQEARDTGKKITGRICAHGHASPRDSLHWYPYKTILSQSFHYNHV